MSSGIAAPIHDISCFGEHDIFDFDAPATNSLFDASWSGVVDPDLDDITSESLETDMARLPSGV